MAPGTDPRTDSRRGDPSAFADASADRRSLGGGRSGSPSGLSWDDLILVGIVARTHGNKGEVIVNPHSDFVEERFVAGALFHMRLGNGPTRQIEVVSARIHQGRPVIRFKGVSSITEAEAFRDAELRIDAAEQAPLADGSFYHHQLIGCLVVGTDGEEIGRVVGIEGEMGRSRLLVDGQGRRVEIPLADELCTVDIERRRITARLPEGLLDL
jgi:16S rRNA processing protein RimM